jgi:hypothetical protein
MQFHIAVCIPGISGTCSCRDISVTHVALGTVRVMRTGGMMGEVVGMAASLCKKYHTDPRGVYEKYLSDLRILMKQGVGKSGFPEAESID